MPHQAASVPLHYVLEGMLTNDHHSSRFSSVAWMKHRRIPGFPSSFLASK